MESKRVLPKRLERQEFSGTTIDIGTSKINRGDCLTLLSSIDFVNKWAYEVLLHQSGIFLSLEVQSDTDIGQFGITQGSYDVKVIGRDEAKKIVTVNNEEFDDFYIDQYINRFTIYYNRDGGKKNF